MSTNPGVATMMTCLPFLSDIEVSLLLDATRREAMQRPRLADGVQKLAGLLARGDPPPRHTPQERCVQMRLVK